MGIYDPETRTCTHCGERKRQPWPPQRSGWARQGNRGKTYDRGYDADWRRVRHLKLVSDPYCQNHLRLGVQAIATQVHHIRPFKGKQDPLRLDINNLQSVCAECHARLSAQESNSRKR